MLGPLEVHCDAEAPADIGGARLRTLAVLLALTPGRVVSTAALIDGVWAGDPPAGAGNALQALVSRLRRAAPGLPIESHPTGYRLALAPDEVDAWRFERLARAGRTALADDPARAAGVLAEALRLWRGDALADVADAPFARAARARLAELRLAAVEDRAEAELRTGAGDGLVPELQAAVAGNPTRERLTELLMRALVAAGRPADALAAYEDLRGRLAETLGTDPSPGLAELHLSILHGQSTMDEPARREPTPSNLRAGLTSFIGRDEELTRVTKLLAENRLVTLIGPGGAGKTRLAVESARSLLDQAPDGVWLVELAPVADPAEVPVAILAALGLREQALIAGRRIAVEATDPAGRLVGALAGKRSLIVLDNCEHLIGAAAATADLLLGACPGVRVLATSREPLSITGEALWPVEPLAMPPVDAGAAEAPGYASVRLFADRAGAVRPGFAVDGDNVGAVVGICRALDGMPLAIELAAARLRALTAEQVAGRLDDRFRLLTGGSRTALARHQTLRAVVDWSWDLLDEAERTVWRRMAVFTDGATMAAASAVCAGGPVAAGDVLDLVSTLVEKSILVATGNGTPRYRMLETIRAYGLERLVEAGEATEVRAAHATYFADLAERTELELLGRRQLEVLRELRDDQENLHAAIRWAIAEGRAEPALRLVAGLGWYWNLIGFRREGADLAAEALALPGPAPETIRGRAYAMGAMNGIGMYGDGPRTQAWFRRALAHARRSGDNHPMMRLMPAIVELFINPSGASTDGRFAHLFHDENPWVRATAQAMFAHADLNDGRENEAEAGFAASLETYRELNERWGIAFTLTAAAELASNRGDHAHAVEMYREAIGRVDQFGTSEDLTHMQAQYGIQLWLLGERKRAGEVLAEAERLAVQIGLPEVLATVDCAVGEVAYAGGDLVEARRRFRRAERALADSVSSPQFQALISASLGLVEAAEGDPAAGLARLRQALGLAVYSHDRPIVRRVLAMIAEITLAQGDPERAATLLGAAADDRGRCDITRERALRTAAEAGKALGAEEYAAAFTRGRALSHVDVCALVGAEVPTGPPAPYPGLARPEA
jgi:predicted ATPase